jgi:hypothetical protein
MPDAITPPDFQETDALLTELLEDVMLNEGFFSGGEEIPLPKGAAAVKKLLETKVRFGHPNNDLIQLTEETFKLSGIELNEFDRQKMRDHDFYYMTLSVDLIPKPGAKFWRLVCEIDFGPKGSAEPIVRTIFPNQKWREVLNYGVGMDLGLDGNLEWNAGIDDDSQIAEVFKFLTPDLKANVLSKNNFKGFITLPAYKYTLGQSEITAAGEGNSICYWRIQDQELQKVGSMKFATVFKVLKGTESITLRGTTWAEPDMNWLTSDVRDVATALQDKFKSLLLRGGDEAASQLARGVSEQWTLTLPKAIPAI